MADNLPDPKSRKESYLAKAAGMDVEIPEKPESREEQYLNAIAEGGGGGGGTSDFNELSNRPKYNGSAMTGDTNIPVAPSVVQTTGTSTTDVMSQKAVTDELYPQYSNKSKGVIGIGSYASIADYGDAKIGIGNVNLGNSSAFALAINGGDSTGTVNAISGMGIWSGAGGSVTGQSGIAIGTRASVSGKGGIAIGRGSSATSQGEFNIGTTDSGYGYNSTNYRLISGVHDPVGAHDAATKGYVDSNAVGTTETFTKAAADWGALSASSPYTYSTTVTLATTLGNDSEVELINDQLVAFANYGFGILSISGQVATIASIGQPDSSITFKIKVRG